MLRVVSELLKSICKIFKNMQVLREIDRVVDFQLHKRGSGVCAIL